MKPLPTPVYRPDLYDGYDGRAESPSDAEKAYWDRLAAQGLGDQAADPARPPA